jgi:hypothetical protein
VEAAVGLDWRGTIASIGVPAPARPLGVCVALVLVAVTVAGCDTTFPQTDRIEATPDVIGTLRAVAGATISAAADSREATPIPVRSGGGSLATRTEQTVTPVPQISRTTTRAPTPTTVARAPAPTATPGILVRPHDFTAYRLQSGWTFIQGFVQNDGPAPAGTIEVHVALVADGDSVVATTRAHIQPTMLAPGSRAPWLAQIRQPPSFARVRVQVQARPFTEILQGTVTHDLRAEQVAVQPPTGPVPSPIIAGEVVNTGQRAASDIRVTAAIFDGDGALFQVVSTLLDGPELPPGQGAPFRLQPVGRGLTEIPRYELFVEGRPRP